MEGIPASSVGGTQFTDQLLQHRADHFLRVTCKRPIYNREIQSINSAALGDLSSLWTHRKMSPRDAFRMFAKHCALHRKWARASLTLGTPKAVFCWAQKKTRFLTSPSWKGNNVSKMCQNISGILQCHVRLSIFIMLRRFLRATRSLFLVNENFSRLLDFAEHLQGRRGGGGVYDVLSVYPWLASWGVKSQRSTSTAKVQRREVMGARSADSAQSLVTISGPFILGIQ